MFEFFWYDAKKRFRGSVYLSIGMSALALIVIWVYPSFSGEFEGDELLEAYPEEILRLFDVRTMTSLEGFLAFEVYMFGWIILLGLYFAYSAAGLIADDIDRGRMDSILALPVSRPRVLGERFAALAVPILIVNVTVPFVVIAGALMIGETPTIVDVFAVHLLSVPYLFACAGIGVVCSVVFNRASIAQRLALGITFGLYLVESLLEGTEVEAIGAISPMRYFDPNEVLLDGSYDLFDTATLVGMTLILVVVSQWLFIRKDV